jgi:pimeloyl-ACP methyl ester carboxylesterase
MAAIIDVHKQMVQANGAELYCEVSGSGPTVLFITGGTGDSGHFDRIKPELADEFTIITFDRRGCSRSPRPAGWSATSMAEWADDTAALLKALGLGPVTVFGTSLGADITLELLLRHPAVARAAVLHEPLIYPVTQAYYEARGQAAVYAQGAERHQEAVSAAMASGGARAALEANFVPIIGEATFRSIDPAILDRAVANSETFFHISAPAMLDYRPDARAVAAIPCPVTVLASAESPSYLFEPTAAWLAECGYPTRPKLAGGHGAYIDRPAEFAAALRPYLREATEVA